MYRKTVRWITWLMLLALSLSLCAPVALASAGEDAAETDAVETYIPAEEESIAAAAAEEIPSEPEAEAPAEPEAETPAEPEAETPAEPEAGTPAEPEAETPAEPEAETPAEPEAETPAETEPATSEEPEEVIEEEPAEESAAEPAAASEEPLELDGAAEYTVSYYDGTTLLATETVTAGGKAVKAPKESGGRIIKAWLNSSGARVDLATTAIGADISLTAWFAPQLRTEAHDRYINGTGNARFSPTSALTRAQAAQILYQLLDSQKLGPFNSTFPDVSDNMWYTDAVRTLASFGVINGYTTGNFRPSRSVTRAEFVTMLVNLTGATGSGSNFTDISSHWAKAAIEAAAGQGWINGYKEKDGTYTFRPNKTISRAEAVVVMNRVLGRSADKNTLATGTGVLHYIDVKTSDWWFADVMEASIGHTYTKNGSAETWTKFNVESCGLEPGLRKVGKTYVYVDSNRQPVYMSAGLNKVDNKFFYAPSAGYTFTGDLSSKAGYVVYSDGTAEAALTSGFNYIGAEKALIYWDLTTASAQYLKAGLNTVAGKTYWADANGYVIRSSFGGGSGPRPVQLGGKTYLTDGACAIVTYGLAYNKDNEKPYNMDLKNRLFEYHGYMYYVQDDYSLLTDGYNGYLYFGKDGRYTSGDAELDAYVWDIIKDFVDNNNLTRVQKLLKAYYVLRGGEGSNYVDNGFFYVRKGTMLTADRYNLQKQNSLLISCAKQMFSVKYGLCYQWGAAYHFIITRLGFQSYVVVGTVGNPGNTGTAHCWNIVKWDGDWYLSDVELEWGWLAGKKGNGQKLYWNLFDQKLSGEWVKSYTNSETNLKYTFPY